MIMTDEQKEALAIVVEAATNELNRCEEKGHEESYNILLEALTIVDRMHRDQA